MTEENNSSFDSSSTGDTNKYSPPDFLSSQKKYEITISLNNENQFPLRNKNSSKFGGEPALGYDRFTKVHDNVIKKLKQSLDQCAKYTLNWELSNKMYFITDSRDKQPTKNYPRYHLHGYVQFTDPFLWQSEIIIEVGQYLGAVQISDQDVDITTGLPFTYDRKKHWDTYINKQRAFLEPEAQKRKLNYVLTNGAKKRVDTKNKDITTFYHQSDSSEEDQ